MPSAANASRPLNASANSLTMPVPADELSKKYANANSIISS